jgi:hypothetical protein
MSKNTNHISHIKSNIVENGKPKLPSENTLIEGEIAINYADGYETLSIKNNSGDVVTFSSDNYYTEQKLGSGFTGANSAKTVTDIIVEDEEVMAAALNDLQANKLDASAYTPIDLSDYYTKENIDDKLGSAFTGANSAVTVTEALSNVNIEVDQVIDSGTSASTHAVATQAVYGVIADNELVWTNAYVVVSGAVHSHTANTSIHRINTVSKIDISDNTLVSCPTNITGVTNDGAQAVVIYENTGNTTDYTVTVNSAYKTSNGSQIILTCFKNGFCKVTYININGTIYASGN